MASPFHVFAGESFLAQVRVNKEVALQYFLSQKYTKVSQVRVTVSWFWMVLAESPQRIVRFFQTALGTLRIS